MMRTLKRSHQTPGHLHRIISGTTPFFPDTKLLTARRVGRSVALNLNEGQWSIIDGGWVVIKSYHQRMHIPSMCKPSLFHNTFHLDTSSTAWTTHGTAGVFPSTNAPPSSGGALACCNPHKIVQSAWSSRRPTQNCPSATSQNSRERQFCLQSLLAEPECGHSEV